MLRNFSYHEKSPKRIISSKVKLVVPLSSPTASPLRKIKSFFTDKYTVIIPNELSSTKSTQKCFGNKEIKRRFHFGNNYLNSITEALDNDTPVVEFKPKRPKRFCP